MRTPVLFSSLGLLACASLLFALLTGSVHLSAAQVIIAVFGGGDELTRTLVNELRLPRALAGFAVGGLLALAGALMQVLLRNPLADPYVLGVSGGAAVAALIALMLGAGGLVLSGSAFAGALLSMLLVFGLAQARNDWSATRLLLTGVVLAAGWGALISLLLAISPEGQLRGMLFWLMGDLDGAGTPWPALGVLLLGLVLVMPLARSLTLLGHGDLQAAVLGVAVQRLRIALYVIASLLTASAVALAGSVGFVGLIVPHLLRLVIGNDPRRLLPACVLFGGSLLVIADTLARSLLAPQQLPVGVLTALLGVPVFLLLLQRAGRQ